MTKEIVKIDNELQQIQEFGIEVYEDHVELAALISKDIEEVDIPEEINGLPVTVIGDDCFFNCENVGWIRIPDSITKIGVQAFALCKRLVELILPDSVTELGHHCFRDCRNLKKVKLSKNIRCLPNGAFSFCYLHEPEIILPEGLEKIDSDAFYSAGSFDLMIPDSVKEIGRGAFIWGPRPITKLEHDKGWWLEWPYGESVIIGDTVAKITGIGHLEEGCEVHEVTTDSGVKSFVYPCDYLDGKISFADEKDRETYEWCIDKKWKSDKEKEETYKIKEAWENGSIAVH